MAKYIFQGPATNLGRFGPVDKGAVVELTEREEAGIKDDKRFRPFTDKAKVTESTAQLDKQNDPETVRRASLSEMTPDQLRATCAELERKGLPIEYRGGADKNALITAILRAENAPK